MRPCKRRAHEPSSMRRTGQMVNKIKVHDDLFNPLRFRGGGGSVAENIHFTPAVQIQLAAGGDKVETG